MEPALREILPGAMSEENLELIRVGFAAHNRGDLDALVEVYDPTWCSNAPRGDPPRQGRHTSDLRGEPKGSVRVHDVVEHQPAHAGGPKGDERHAKL
jgi:ketosteroid isomerase-like protein